MRWSLLNAGPDLRSQILSFPELLPRGGTRGSAIDAVLLNDAELDHISGLLSLREPQPVQLHCTERVFEWVFESNPVFGALIQPERFSPIIVMNRTPTPIDDGRLGYEAILVEGKVPSYVKHSPECFVGSTAAYKIVDTGNGSSMIHAPAIKGISDELIDWIAGCDCVLFDGSFWTNDEMATRGVGNRTALSMGHIPISGPAGSLARLSHLAVRKIYTHVNNTNPILDEGSLERSALEEAGWEVAEDGMDFSV
jgi:pyrroloquinoline quinone biosynthesis protein B